MAVADPEHRPYGTADPGTCRMAAADRDTMGNIRYGCPGKSACAPDSRRAVPGRVRFPGLTRKNFGGQGSFFMLKPLLTTTDPARYEEYLREKITAARELLRSCSPDLPEFTVCRSLPEFYRMRAEFAICREQGKLCFAMFEKHGRDRERILLDTFPVACRSINLGMQLLQQYAPDFEELTCRLFEASFLASSCGSLVISLNYHRRLNAEVWKAAALKLRERLHAAGLKAELTGRARKQKITALSDTLTETLQVSGREFSWLQTEGCFTQPNAGICRQMLEFAQSCCTGCRERDLLELYCGCGTFTVCLSGLFRRVLATEVNRTATAAAVKNLELNGAGNTRVVRLSAVEVAEALEGVREFVRLKKAGVDPASYDFSTLLIDPPREGLKFREARDFAARFPRIIYISCSPRSLAEDLGYLKRTHRIARLAFFDQFPYTPHLESGVLLLKNT